MNNKYECDLISVNKRKGVISDRVLIDVTKWVNKTNFKIPVALTKSLWTTIENIPEWSGHNIEDRVHFVFFIASLAVREAQRIGEQSVTFELIVLKPEMINFKADLIIHISPGDKSEPVITIGFPEDF